MGKRDEQKEKRRNQILFTALHLFVTKGYAATKISDIAKGASMSVGLLFHYFESKEVLYEELVKLGLEGTRMPLKKEGISPIEYFEQFAVELFSFMKSQPLVAEMFVLMADAQFNEGVPQRARELAKQVDTIEQFIPIIERGQKEGCIRQGDAGALSNAFWCSIQGIAEYYARNPGMKLPEAGWIVDIIKSL